MSGLVQRLRDLYRGWSLELLANGEAHREGLRLLKENLTPRQRDELEVFNYFDVVGGVTGTPYRIHFGDRMNIDQLDARGKCSRVLCFVPEGQLPVGDTMLAQKLALELFETEVLEKANRVLPWQVPAPFDLRHYGSGRRRGGT
jgi:hypothetical protein